MRLILIRHAKTESDPPKGGKDFDRVLTERGRHEATRLGVRLAEAGYTPDVAVVSGAARTRETWEYVAKAWGAIETNAFRELYDSDPATILEYARKAGAETVAVVVHNPGAQLLAVDLMRRAGADEEARRAEGKFPTASAVVAELRGSEPRFEAVFYPEDDPADR